MIDLESIRNYCLKKEGKITEEFPFDEEVLVFKVSNKIFLLTNVNAVPLTVNLKCDPERAIEWRERYEDVQPGFHMHKKYWNTVHVNRSLSERLFLEMIDHSYDEVVKKLPKSGGKKKTVSKEKNKKSKRKFIVRKAKK
ncbi:MAG: MmcQ/YjbR family DNA-binding protein [Bacteroidota bacterium]